ncbi:MAG: 50S ribosomal protein L19 [Myxococcales bacterium]|nr:50S ribosomal protein L19 [Myxococcales bacterium]
MNIVDLIGRTQMREDIPRFRGGDTVRVHVKIREGDKERVQAFEGVCISRHKNGAASTFTVRKLSYGVGVERIFPLHSPKIQKIDVISRGRVRRSRTYYLRGLRGKAARIKELRDQAE